MAANASPMMEWNTSAVLSNPGASRKRGYQPRHLALMSAMNR